MSEWEDEQWNTTAPLTPFDFDSPERAPEWAPAPVQQNIPAFEPNTRPGYRPAPPQQQQPIVGGPYSRLIGSNWQNPSFGPAQGAQEFTQGWANIPTGMYQLGKQGYEDPGGTAKAMGQALIDPATYGHMFESAIGLQGVEGMGEFWAGMAIPGPNVRKNLKGKLYNAVRDRPGYKSVRQDLKGVGRTVYDKRPDGGRDFHWGRPGHEHGNLVADFMRTQKAAAKKHGPGFSGEGINQDLWRMIREDPYVFARNADQAAFSAQRKAGGWYDPSTRRVTVPRVKDKWSKNLNRHEDAHAIWDKQINKGLHREGIRHASTPGPDGSPRFPHANYPVFRGPERGKSYNYMNELNSNVVGAKSVTQGLRDWGRSLSQKDGLYQNHGGRAAGYATRALGEAMYGAQTLTPRVIRTGILMNDIPSKEGLPAENTGIDRTKFYTP